MRHIFKCPKCSCYTLKESCPGCKHKTIMPRPPKFSPEDKYGSYRRKVKTQALKDKGLL
jgi:H/ACA ribonucleoprotein complex subunit 3|tara:strand:+ start:2672 stop:2848 length:177 start_codon:yes stop_codon:yes gene_type:complete